MLSYRQLISISRELEDLKSRFDDCSKDKDAFKDELMSTKEDIEIFSYQSKIVRLFVISIDLLVLIVFSSNL